MRTQRRFTKAILVATIAITAFCAIPPVEAQAGVRNDPVTVTLTDPNPPGAAAGYRVYMGTNQVGTYTLVASSSSKSITVTNVPDTSVWFRATAYNSNSESAPSQSVNLPAVLLAPSAIQLSGSLTITNIITIPIGSP